MKRSIILFVLLILAGLFLIGCEAIPGRSQATEEPVITPVEGSIASSVISEGRLVPGQEKPLSFLSSGEVADVMVKNGDQVTAGQVLARLSNVEQIESTIAAANLELTAAQQNYDALVRLAALDRANAWGNLTRANDSVIAASRAWDQIDTEDTRDDIEKAEEDIIEARDDLDDAQEKFDKYSGLPEDNRKRKNAANKLEDAQNDYNEAVRKRDQLVNALDQAKASLDSAIEQQAETQRVYDNLQNGADPDKLALAEKRLENAKSQLAAGQALFDNQELRAPFAGEIVDVNIVPGQIIVPGSLAIQIADFSEWYLETTDLTEIEVVKITEGQKVSAFLDALKDVKLNGVVEEIYKVPGVQSGDVVYLARIKLSTTNPLFRWGMTAEINFEEES